MITSELESSKRFLMYRIDTSANRLELSSPKGQFLLTLWPNIEANSSYRDLTLELYKV